MTWSNLITPRAPDAPRLGGCVANATGIGYGAVVCGDPATTNFRDVKLSPGAASSGIRGVCVDVGLPSNGGLLQLGDEFSACVGGLCDVLLDSGMSCTKDSWLITGATPGTVKPVGSEAAPYDFIGQAAGTYVNTTSAPMLIRIYVRIERRFA